VKAAVQTIETLRATLQTGLLSAAAETAAAQYARLCAEAETRMEMIAAMLAKGSDYQALQTAEQEPPLLDLVGVLSFGGERAWQDFCQAHQLPVAPRIDAKTVQVLDRLYAQGVTANHPLYKDFRSAVLLRDDAKALRIMRTILKLNPADENARSELQRLENKHFQDKLEQLRAALKTDDEERIAKLAEEIAHAAPEEKLRPLPDYQQADGIRRSLRRRQAEAGLPTLLDEASAKKDASDWRGTAVTMEAVNGLLETHEIELPPGSLKEKLDALNSHVRKERLAAEQRRGFDRALGAFVTFVEEVETRLLTGGGYSYAETLDRDESFVRRWRELESFQLPVPNDTLQRLRQAGQELRKRLERMQSARRARTMLATAAVIALMLGIAAVTWHAWQARTFAGELVGYRARYVCEPAEKLAASLRADEPLMLRWPFLKTKIEETEVWTKQARSLAAQADAALLDLETKAKANFANVEPSAVIRQTEDAHALLGQLPGDLAVAPSNRLAALRTKSALLLADVSGQRTGKARETLAGVTTLIESDLSYERPVQAVAAAFQKIETMLVGLEDWLNPETDALRLPADLDARVKAARQRVNGFKAELDRLAQVREGTAGAQTLADYKKALSAWQDIRFAEAAPASAALNAIPTEERFLAALMTGGDLTLWRAAIEDSCGPHLAPDTPSDTDLKVLLALRDDRKLNGVWENTIVDYSRGRAERTVYSQGRLTEASAGDTIRRWSGLTYDPYPSDVGAAFTQRDFKRMTILDGSYQGQGLVSGRLSHTSNLLESLQLHRMTDANGERFQRNLLEVFDKLMQHKTASPLAKAHVMLELERMTRGRPFAWGLHVCPSLRGDLAELRKITSAYPLRSEDWMVAKARTALNGTLTKFFESRTGRTYEKEAVARRELLREIALAGLKFGGYVEVDLLLRHNNPARTASELWVLSKAGHLPLRVASPDAAATGALPLSPVFFIPADRAALMQRYQQSLAGADATESGATPAATETPFLKAP